MELHKLLERLWNSETIYSILHSTGEWCYKEEKQNVGEVCTEYD